MQHEDVAARPAVHTPPHPSSPPASEPTHAVHLDEGPDDVLYLTFDDPERKVNVLTLDVLEQLERVLDHLARTTDAKVVIARSFKPDCFIAGADLESISMVSNKSEAMEASRYGQRVFAKVETLRMPVIAAVDGVCLGGGTEFALACHYRLVSDRPSTRIGLPEVKLGILPAWGGTQRLPKLVGLARALDLILTGRSIDGRQAKKIGLAEQVVPRDLFAGTVLSYARQVLAERRGPRRARPKLSAVERLAQWLPLGRRIIFEQAAERVFKTTHGHYPAPPRALEAVRIGVERGNRAGYLLEATFVAELVTGPVSRNLVQLFFATEAVRKSRGVTEPVAEPPRIGKIGLLGAGVMGGGIAQLASAAGLQVRMKDIDRAALASALRHARSINQRRVDRRRMTSREMEQQLSLISPTLDYSGFRSAPFVIEAVVEDLMIKRRVFHELEEHIGDDTVVVSNTSSLLISDMASAFRHPQRFGGMHFFHPVHRLPLVEVIRGARTEASAVALIYSVARRLGKTPIVVRDRPGFLVNRILMPYLNEACRLLEEGAQVEQIDQAMLNFGMPMGPLRLLDEVGLDVANHAAKVLAQAFAEQFRPSGLLEALHRAGRRGRKGGLGFYRHQDGKKEGIAVPDPAIYPIVEGLGGGVPGGSVILDNVHDRLLLPMINEAARCLEEDVVARPMDVDLGMVMGAGFPPFRGGLLRHADALGVADVVGQMRALADGGRPEFEPTTLLVSMARSGDRFYTDP